MQVGYRFLSRVSPLMPDRGKSRHRLVIPKGEKKWLGDMTLSLA